MAREESDREDLLREATALVERAEIQLKDGESIVVGFRRDGSASVFFGGEPVYQFNARDELRRAFVGGRIIKAENGRLASLERRREAARVVLLRHELDLQEAEALCTEMMDRLSRLRTALATGEFTLVGQAPADSDIVARIRCWLDGLGKRIAIANAPHVKTQD